MAAAVLTSGGLSTYNQLAATRILITALEEQGIDVDETIPTLPDAQPAEMPAELVQNSGYYGATAAQYEISVSEDGVLAIHYLNYPAIPDQTFTYYSDGSFRDATGTAALRFVQEDNGQTYLYQRAFLRSRSSVPCRFPITQRSSWRKATFRKRCRLCGTVWR